MQSENLMPCGHAVCKCLAETEDLFCSKACADAEGRQIVPYPCAHAECADNQPNTGRQNSSLLSTGEMQNAAVSTRCSVGPLAPRL